MLLAYCYDEVQPVIDPFFTSIGLSADVNLGGFTAVAMTCGSMAGSRDQWGQDQWDQWGQSHWINGVRVIDFYMSSY